MSELYANPALAGVERPPAIAFAFDGEPIAALPGQTIAAALIAAGRRRLGTTRGSGRSRGVFCGIGVCFDCLVVHNGRPGVRACVTPVADGDVVESREGRRR